MSDPYLGEIRINSFQFAPKNWVFCDGQVLPINSNVALFSLLGTTYGGNGVTTFQLPDLRGRVPMSAGPSNPQGSLAGQESHTLIIAEMPGHSHPLNVVSGNATSQNPSNSYLASIPDLDAPCYVTSAPDTPLNAAAVGTNPGGIAHENRQPYLVLNYVMAMTGIFPSRG